MNFCPKCGALLQVVKKGNRSLSLPKMQIPGASKTRRGKTKNKRALWQVGRNCCHRQTSSITKTNAESKRDLSNMRSHRKRDVECGSSGRGYPFNNHFLQMHKVWGNKKRIRMTCFRPPQYSFSQNSKPKCNGKSFYHAKIHLGETLQKSSIELQLKHLNVYFA